MCIRANKLMLLWCKSKCSEHMVKRWFFLISTVCLEPLAVTTSVFLWIMCDYSLGSWSQRRWATEHPQLPPYHAWGRHSYCCSWSRDLTTRWQHSTALLYSVFLPPYTQSKRKQFLLLKAALLFLVRGPDRSSFVYGGVMHNNESVRSVSNTELCKNEGQLLHWLEKPPTCCSVSFLYRANIVLVVLSIMSTEFLLPILITAHHLHMYSNS